jgi:hypothetical protein
MVLGRELEYAASVGPVLHLSMRLVLTYQSWGGQSSDSIGANVAAQFLSYYDDPYLSLAVQVCELRLGGILVASLIFFRYRVHLSLSCTQHNVRALRSISNRGSDGHARALAFRE